MVRKSKASARGSVSLEAFAARVLLAEAAEQTLDLQYYIWHNDTSGSLLFDPRSARLNTEIGFLIESPALARAMGGAFDDRVAEQSYRVRLADDGGLVWHEQTQEGEVIHRTEPNTGLLRRAAVKVMSWLPIEWLL